VLSLLSMIMWIGGTQASGFQGNLFAQMLGLNQSAVIGNQAVTGIAASLNDSTVDATTIQQIGAGLQNAGNVSASTTTDGAAVNAGAVNNAGVTQQAPIGATQVNQGVLADLGAVTTLALQQGGVAGNLTGIGQISVGPSTSQNAANVGVAGTDMDSSVNVGSSNTLGVFQDPVGPANQSVDAAAVAASLVSDGIAGAALNVSGITQVAVGPSVNQNVFNGVIANTFITSIQNVNTSNALNVIQLCGSGCNQAANVELTALSFVGQQVIGTSANQNVIGQTAVGGNGQNQNLGNLSVADAATLAGQGISTTNGVTILQVAGNGPTNQSAPVSLTAASEALQLVCAGSMNANQLTQTAVGGLGQNQSLGNLAVAGAAAIGLQDVATGNTVGVLQANGNGQGNQDAPVTAIAIGGASQEVIGTATNLNLLGQTAVGGAGQNQNLSNGSLAETVALGDQTVTTGNLVGIAQLNGGAQGNQSAPVTAVALAGAQQQVGGTSGNTNVLGQTAVGGTGVNQGLTNGTSAGTLAAGSQDVATGNGIGIAQINGGNQGNQSAPVSALADADASQFVLGTSANQNVLGQTAVGGGQQNQQIGNTSDAGTLVGATQGVTTGNAVGIAQINGGLQGNQSAPVSVAAGSTADQTVLGTSGNLNVLGQTAVGGSQQNQGLTNDTSAGTLVGAAQDVSTGNQVGVLQINGGAQGNQNAPIAALADADASQTVIAGAANGNVLTQAGLGNGQGNQVADNTSTADAGALVGQNVNTGNNIGVLQANGNGQATQNADIDAVAVTGAQQVVGVGAVNGNSIDQLSLGGQSNQDASNDTSATAGALVGQNVGAANNVGVAQTATSTNGANSQSVNVAPTAVVGASQGVGAVSGNLNSISQDPTQANQNADNTSDALTLVGADQDASATNNVQATQNSAVNFGAGAQSADITPVAVVGAQQGVVGASGNLNTIDQDATGTGNQSATNDTSAGTLVGAGQTAAATNNVTLGQNENLNHGAGAQYVSVTPVAVVGANQQVAGVSGNQNSIDQDGGANGAGNQAVDNTTSAGTLVGADQDASAVNNVNLQQNANANHGAVAQAGNVTPTAVTTANQGIGAGSVNGTTVSQDQNGAGNQGVSNDSAALTGVDATQGAASDNTVNASQNCNVAFGACAQYFDADPTAVTSANQQVAAGSGNSNDISQSQTNGGGNQQADNTTSAGTLVGADQDAGAHNTDNIVQTCTVSGGVCAQYTGSTQNAGTDANQNVSGASGNQNTIDQDAAGNTPGNQAATNGTSAGTVIGAGQTADTGNTSNVLQVGAGANQGSQGATNTQNAATTANQNVAGTSNNVNGITQTGNGGNQNAGNTSNALTTIGATQNAGSHNVFNLGQFSTGGSQTATNNANANTTSNLTVNGTSGNTTNIVQQ
jgi:hypothetical protein